MSTAEERERFQARLWAQHREERKRWLAEREVAERHKREILDEFVYRLGVAGMQWHEVEDLHFDLLEVDIEDLAAAMLDQARACRLHDALAVRFGHAPSLAELQGPSHDEIGNDDF